jgi:hypothetical protein
MDSNMVV